MEFLKKPIATAVPLEIIFRALAVSCRHLGSECPIQGMPCWVEQLVQNRSIQRLFNTSDDRRGPHPTPHICGRHVSFV
jgi:hypothetical protein